MLTVNDAASTTPGSAPTRLALAQSTATSTRSPKSAGRSRWRPRLSSSRKRYSPGIGAGPPRNMTTSLPRARSARPAPSSEPSASPSGASWEVTTKRSFSFRAATACMSVWFDIGFGIRGRELVDDLREPNPPLDRGIVFERQDRGPTGAEAPCDVRLKDSVCCSQTLERSLLLSVTPEHADVDGGVLVACRGLDAGHRHEPNP